MDLSLKSPSQRAQQPYQHVLEHTSLHPRAEADFLLPARPSPALEMANLVLWIAGHLHSGYNFSDVLSTKAHWYTRGRFSSLDDSAHSL